MDEAYAAINMTGDHFIHLIKYKELLAAPKGEFPSTCLSGIKNWHAGRNQHVQTTLGAPTTTLDICPSMFKLNNI